VHHQATDSSYFAEQGGDEQYSNSFTCMPLANMYRPALLPRPVMMGPQSALVTGPDGEEIFIDEFGRIKVQFMWDREGKKDENSSCFIRVMQSFAGNGWGSSFIPRIGHEVIITFLDGDPDRPIVTGAVYNGNNRPPYSSKTQSGIKTHSTKNGGADNYNEIRFEDKKSSEQVYIQAEKNLDTLVKNDESTDVGNDDKLTVGNNRTKSVKNDETITIGNNQTKSVGNDETITIKNDRFKTVNNNQNETISKNKTIDVGKNHLETIVGNMTINVDKDLTEVIKGAYIEKVTKEYSANAKSITLEALDEIILKTGSAKIIMKKNGDITISGKNINVKGSGNVVLKGSKVLAN
jgi:type VI secretion system secreted protein VgrG